MIPGTRGRADKTMPVSPVHAAMLAATLLLGVGGCGDGANKRAGATATTSAAAPPAPTARTGVTIQAFKYAPPSITTTVGAKLTFKNSDNAEHTATADMRSAFDTGAIPRGQARTITVTRAGTFAYHCDFHPFMHGTVVVRGGPRPARSKPPAPASRPTSPRSAPPRDTGSGGKGRSGRSGGVEGGNTAGGY